MKDVFATETILEELRENVLEGCNHVYLMDKIHQGIAQVKEIIEENKPTELEKQLDDAREGVAHWRERTKRAEELINKYYPLVVGMKRALEKCGGSKAAQRAIKQLEDINYQVDIYSGNQSDDVRKGLTKPVTDMSDRHL